MIHGCINFIFSQGGDSLKISNSAVRMNSTHSSAQADSRITATILRQNGNTRMSVSSQNSVSTSASMHISEEAREKLEEHRSMLSDLQEEARKNNAKQTLSQPNQINFSLPDFRETADRFNFQALRKILEAMKMFHGNYGKYVSLESGQTKASSLRLSLTSSSSDSSVPAQNRGSTTWNREIRSSQFTAEAEATTFSAEGIVQTSDGRSISFNVDLEMSREFIQATEFVTKDTVQIMTDPLVINMDVDSAEVTGQKFFFDIDSDGKEDEISRLGTGSGFLALDKNGDGIIGNGSELFGAKTGDGFSELAEYDSDGNGWIDENDSIFSSLKVWTKDSDGNDHLLSLKEADVGAIYLGNTSTDFSLNNAITNQTNAQIRKTGIYLRETGGAGTVQHVDFAL